MIPKTIHYCWFGRNPKPKLAEDCIRSWKKYCPDYEIVEWNEDTFDVNSNVYVKEAYESKKWAFVTDVVRLHALCYYGGIYMDTDVEVIKPLDRFLEHAAFSGFEDLINIPTGIMAAEKGHPLFQKFLSYYENRHFLINGEPDLTTNVETITNMLTPMGFISNNQYQEVAGLTLYPYDYFCPCDVHTMKVTVTENSYTIHHFAGSWLPKQEVQRRTYKLRKNRIEKYMGKHAANIYESFFYSQKSKGGDGIRRFLWSAFKRRISPHD